jgi:hypothetical protein
LPAVIRFARIFLGRVVARAAVIWLVLSIVLVAAQAAFPPDDGTDAVPTGAGSHVLSAPHPFLPLAGALLIALFLSDLAATKKGETLLLANMGISRFHIAGATCATIVTLELLRIFALR